MRATRCDAERAMMPQGAALRSSDALPARWVFGDAVLAPAVRSVSQPQQSQRSTPCVRLTLHPFVRLPPHPSVRLPPHAGCGPCLCDLQLQLGARRQAAPPQLLRQQRPERPQRRVQAHDKARPGCEVSVHAGRVGELAAAGQQGVAAVALVVQKTALRAERRSCERSAPV